MENSEMINKSRSWLPNIKFGSVCAQRQGILRLTGGYHVHMQVYRGNLINFSRVDHLDYVTTKFNKTDGSKIY